MSKLVCSVCGGLNVQIKSWVDANTNEFGDDGNLDTEDTWCQDCEDHTGLMFKKDYDKQED